MRRRRQPQATKTTTELERLADWLLEESVSFTKLDGFRRRLGLTYEDFCTLLGVSRSMFMGWRRNRTVSLRNRDSCHAVVTRWVAEYQYVAEASQNTRLGAVLGGLECQNGPVLVVTTPSRSTTPDPNLKNSPHLFIPLPTKRPGPKPLLAEVLLREIGGELAARQHRR